MYKFTKGPITRLSVRAGVVCITPGACEYASQIIFQDIEKIINKTLYITKQKKSKTIMFEHLRQALKLQNINITK